MNHRTPPRLAVALLKWFGLGRDEAFVGDLVEEFRGGRTAGWFWRQTLTAILAATVKADRGSSLLALLVERGAMASIAAGFLWIHGPLHVGWKPALLLATLLLGLAALTDASRRAGHLRHIFIDLMWVIVTSWAVVVGISFISPFLGLTISPLGTLLGFMMTLPGGIWRAIRRRRSEVRPG